MKPKRPQRRRSVDGATRAAANEQRRNRSVSGAERPLAAGRWSDWKAMGSYGTLGLEVVLSVLFGLFVGRWADGKLGTSPYLALAGFALGVAAAGRAVFRVAREMQRETANDGWRESQTDRPALPTRDEQSADGTQDEPSDDPDQHDRPEPR